MEHENLIKYLRSVTVLLNIKNKGLIDEKDYEKGEQHLAKKYGIKNGNLYRINNLLLTPFRVINISDGKGKKFNGNDDNENRIVSKIKKET